MAPPSPIDPARTQQSKPQETFFSYEPLENDTHQIRLLRLERASEGPIQGQLVVQDLGPGACYPYEAVSYVWGDPNLRETIWVNGQQMSVTRNAHDMLDNLRKAGHEYIWVDAVCINQRDNVERSHQVQQMREIYHSARRVVIYLGQSTPDTDFLFKSMPLLHQNPKSKVHWSTGPGRTSEVARPRLEVDPADAERLRSGMHDLLSRSYFERVWIIQEISLPVEGIVCCGDWSVPCETFVTIADLLQVHTSAYRSRMVHTMPTLHRKVTLFDGDKSTEDLYGVLMKYREAKASDERDRIYALLGLVRSQLDNNRLVVDYGQPEAEVVRHATAHICGCKLECLPSHVTAPTIASFLDNLHTLHTSVLAQLVQCTHAEADDDVHFMLMHPGERLEITPAVLRDASMNPVYAREMTDILELFKTSEGRRSGSSESGGWDMWLVKMGLSNRSR